jgi:heme-degrading monooxygenase HmoA
MIGRVWRGVAAHASADAYEGHLRTQTIPELDRIDGFAGSYVLRRPIEEGVEFVVLTLWASADAIRAFAGSDYDVAVVPEEARRLLLRFDERADHFEVAIGPT